MQFDFGTIDPYVVDGIALANILNTWRDAEYSYHRGPTRPAYVVPGQLWIDDSAGTTAWVLTQFISPTLGDVPIFTINTVTAQITLAATMRAVTPASPTDNSLAVPTTAWVQGAIAAGIQAALSMLMPVGTILDVPGIIVIAPVGFILSGAGTIGAATSGATIRANADCQPLFSHVWTLNNAEAPLYDALGAPVARGGSALDDFGMNRRIGGLDFRGVVRASNDASAGRLPFARTGQIGGAYYHYLTATEMPNHGHGLNLGGVGISDSGHAHNVPQGAFAGFGSGGYVGGGNLGSTNPDTNSVGTGVSAYLNGSWSVAAAGGNGWHNNVQSTRMVTTLVKL
jgi:microcystin-dependent protein